MKATHTFLLMCAALLLLPIVAAAGVNSGCIVCHNASVGTVTGEKGEVNLRVDPARFDRSVHGFLSCTDCHEKYAGNPHAAPSGYVSPEVQKIAQEVRPKAQADPVAMAACSKCHPEIYEKVLGSVHGENVVEKGKTDGALCVDCHGSPHYVLASDASTSPVNRANVVQTCGTCHRNGGVAASYDIEGDVMKTFEESFHGKKLALGHTGAPTCINCHGYHDVKASDDPTSPVFGANKIKTCGKCHEGANQKFVAAITHQEVGPIPHYAEKGLILLTMSVIAFTVMHVILEAYADIRDTFFRRVPAEAKKKKEEEEEETA
ncbi:MAG: cytochrome c3 family protein [Nitrospirota bacterium]|jgi:hypothetical protein